MAEVKLCKNCAFHGGGQCCVPVPDVVNGGDAPTRRVDERHREQASMKCEQMRYSGPCGYDGRFWQASS